MGNKNNINSSRRERNVEADINYWGVIYIFYSLCHLSTTNSARLIKK